MKSARFHESKLKLGKALSFLFRFMKLRFLLYFTFSRLFVERLTLDGIKANFPAYCFI